MNVKELHQHLQDLIDSGHGNAEVNVVVKVIDKYDPITVRVVRLAGYFYKDEGIKLYTEKALVKHEDLPKFMELEHAQELYK